MIDNLHDLQDSDLRSLRRQITEVLDGRRPGYQPTVRRYEFHHSYAPAQQPKPYVARLILTCGAIEREFYDIPKTGKGTQRITFRGRFEAADLDLIEEEHSQISEGQLVTYRATFIAFRGELCEIDFPDGDVSTNDLIEFLSGNRAALVPTIEYQLARYKNLFGTGHATVMAFEGLLKFVSAS